MYHALEIDELLVNILDYVQDRNTFLAVAGAHRRFAPAALSYLWKKFTRVNLRMLRTMALKPAKKFTHISCHSLSGQIRFYGGLVRKMSIDLTVFPEEMSYWRTTIKKLQSASCDELLFPNLNSLYVTFNAPEHLRIAAHVVGPNLTELTLTFNEGGERTADWTTAYTKVLSRIRDIAGVLREFNLMGTGPVSPIFSLQFAPLAPQLVALRSIDLPAAVVDIPILEALARLPLRELGLRDISIVHVNLWALADFGGSSPFHSVTSVSLDGSIASVVKFLRLFPHTLVDIDVDVIVLRFMAPEVPALTSLIAQSQATLSSLTLRFGTVDITRDAFALRWLDLLPLLNCRRMEAFTLLFNVTGAFPLRDSHFTDFGNAWPNLRLFSCRWLQDALFTSYGLSDSGDVTFQGVVTLARLSPNLTEVTVSHIDFTNTSHPAPIGGSLQKITVDNAELISPLFVAAMLFLTGRDLRVVGLRSQVWHEIECHLDVFRASHNG